MSDRRTVWEQFRDSALDAVINGILEGCLQLFWFLVRYAIELVAAMLDGV